MKNEMKRKCNKKHVWQPNFVDTKSYKRGFMWKCFCCGKVKKELE